MAANTIHKSLHQRYSGGGWVGIKVTDSTSHAVQTIDEQIIRFEFDRGDTVKVDIVGKKVFHVSRQEILRLAELIKMESDFYWGGETWPLT